jgi:methylmalonyl-CoA epimerase
LNDLSVTGLIRQVDHVGIAVTDLDDAVALYGDVLGGRFISGGDNDETGIRLVHFILPGMKIELLQPMRESSLLADHLRKKGPGVHHITIMVDDVPATIEALAKHDLTAIGTSEPHPRWSETFLPPARTGGALLQFVSTTMRWDRPAHNYGLGDVLAGKVRWVDWAACVRPDAEGEHVDPAGD